MHDLVELLSAGFGIEVQLNGDGTWRGPITKTQWAALKDALAEKVPA